MSTPERLADDGDGAAVPPAKIARADLGLGSARVPPRDWREQRLVEIWQDALDVAPIGVEDDYYQLGGSSLQAFEIFLGIEEAFGVGLPLSLLVEGPTIANLAAAIARRSAKRDGRCLVALQPAGWKPPLFCVHDLSGTVVALRELARCLAPDRPCYGLQYPDQDRSPLPRLSVEDLANRYVDEIQARQPAGPYLVGGFSIGAVIAYEMARQLIARGHELAALINLDGGAPGVPAEGLRKHLDHARELARRPPWTWPAYLRTRAGYRRARRRQLIAAAKDAAPDGPIAVLANDILPRAKASYTPGPYPGGMHIFRCAEDSVVWRRAPALGWRDHVRGEIVIHDVPATHQMLMTTPAVELLAQKLRACLEETSGAFAARDLDQARPSTASR